MGNRVGQKIKLTSLDELLCVPDSSGTSELPVDQIRPFRNHPYKVVDDEKMEELVESISANGVLTPVIVRPAEEGLYEMISGHRRLHAAEKAGIAKIPAMIRDVSDDEATIMMVDSNFQREEILPSEKAFAYKMRYEAMRRQGDRTDLTSSLIGTKLRADEQLAKDVGESRNQVQRIMRLTEVIPEFLEMTDSKKLALYTAVELSYFPEKVQKWIYSYIWENGMLQTSEVGALRRNEDVESLTKDDVYKFFNSMRPASSKKVSKKLSLPGDKLDKYFPLDMSQEERERVIYELLEKWRREKRGV